MDTQKRVNQRLQKIALKNQKVDLGKIDDLFGGQGIKFKIKLLQREYFKMLKFKKFFQK